VLLDRAQQSLNRLEIVPRLPGAWGVEQEQPNKESPLVHHVPANLNTSGEAGPDSRAAAVVSEQEDSVPIVNA
jgi:hypothetical protein